MIEQRNLFRIQSKLTRDNKTIPVKSIEKDYVLSWILIGIAKTKVYDILSFKGGTALKKFYFPDYRFSEDLDFTLLKDLPVEDLEKMLREVYTFVLDNSNIRMALKNREIHKNWLYFLYKFFRTFGCRYNKRSNQNGLHKG